MIIFYYILNFNYLALADENIICTLQMIEEEEIEVPVSSGKEGSKEDKETASMETDDAQNNGTSAAGDNPDINMQDAKTAPGPATAGTTGAENGFPEAEDKAAQMETDAKVCPIVIFSSCFFPIFLRKEGFVGKFLVPNKNKINIDIED